MCFDCRNSSCDRWVSRIMQGSQLNNHINMNEILKDYGWCQLSIRENKFYFKFDTGGVVIQMTEFEVAENDTEKILKNEFEAEKIAKNILKKA